METPRQVFSREEQLRTIFLTEHLWCLLLNQMVPIMLTCINLEKEFYHLNYQMTGKYLTNKTTFSTKINLMKYSEQTYMLMRTWNLLFVYFRGTSH